MLTKRRVLMFLMLPIYGSTDGKNKKKSVNSKRWLLKYCEIIVKWTFIIMPPFHRWNLRCKFHKNMISHYLYYVYIRIENRGTGTAWHEMWFSLKVASGILLWITPHLRECSAIFRFSDTTSRDFAKCLHKLFINETLWQVLVNCRM